MRETMASQRLGKRLAKEIQRGGMKSIVLGLLLLAGSYFWIPMLLRVVSPIRDESTPAAAASKPDTKISPKVIPSQTGTVANRLSADWKTLQRRLESMATLQPVTLDELVRDPFDQEWIRGKKRLMEVIKPDMEITSHRDPIRSLGCSGTLVGEQGSAAVIGDEVYRLGQEVPRKGTVRYVLKEIRLDRVVLERAGKEIEIPVKLPQEVEP